MPQQRQPPAPVGVVGGGAMGAGIAQLAAAAGHPVVLLEVDRERADAAVDRVRLALALAAEKRRMDPVVAEGARAGLLGTCRVEDLSGCVLVLEAVAEDLGLKRDLLRRVEDVVDADTVLATNTSSLSIDALAARLHDPSRLVGMHFFNPAPVLPLVEIVSGLRTSAVAADTAERMAEGWGKTTVRCASTPGFVVNRIARPFYSEALALVDQTGLDPAVLDQLYREAGGFRMGPLELTDLIGQDVNFAVTRSVWQGLHLDPRLRPSALQERLVDAGWLGRKTGRGFYDRYPTPAPSRALPAAAVPFERARFGPRSPLQPLLTRTGLMCEPHDDLGSWARLPSGTLLGLTDGEPATAAASRLGTDVVLLDLALDWATTARVGAAVNAQAAPDVLDEVRALLAAADVAVTVLPDVPGLLIARTVALLVDEAVDLAARQGLAPAVLDDAVRLGVNYPLGPIEWGDRVGVGWVVRLLDALEHAQPGGRFRVCTPLRAAALTGGRLRGR